MLHANVYGVVPLLTVKEIKPLALPQLAFITEVLSDGVIVPFTVADATFVQPAALVTVTL